MLGSACGTCPRCVREMPLIVSKLREVCDNQLDLITRLAQHAPHVVKNGDREYDIVDEFKVRCFDEMRRILYERKPP